MTKKQYLRKLRKALRGLPASEKEKLIEYYAEIIDESFERGKTNREVFEDLESPEQVAADYFNANEGPVGGLYDDDLPRRRHRPDDYYKEYDAPKRRREADYGDYEPPKKRGREPRKRSGRNPLITVLLIPLYLIAFLLGLAAILVGAALVVTVVALVVAFFAGGLYMVVMSFGLFPAHGWVAASQIGAGVLLVGLSLFCGLLVAPTARGFGRFSGWLFRGCRPSDKVRTAHSHGGTVATVAAGLVFVVAGGAAFGFGFGKLDWNWRNLAVMGNMREVSQSFTLDGLENFAVVSDNLALDVVAEGTEAKIVYFESDELPKTYSFEDGKLTISCGKWANNAGEYMKETWKRGVMFSTIASLSNRATLYLPTTYSGDLAIKINNGAMSMENVALGNATLEVDNGAVVVENSSFGTVSAIAENGALRLDAVRADAVRAVTNNGAIRLNEVQAGSVRAEADNGELRLNEVDGTDVFLKADNGTIRGNLIGKKTDYKITASAHLGSCNLTNTETGTRTLTAKTSCGAIRIHFEN